MPSPVGSYTLYTSNEDRQIRNVEGCQKYMCTASKSSPLIKSSRQPTKLFSSDERKWSSKSRQEHGYNKKYSMDPEPELSVSKIKSHKAHKNDKYFVIPRTQSSININQTTIYVNQSCRSLASLLNSQQFVTTPCNNSCSNEKQLNKPQRVNNGDYSSGNQKMLREKNKRINGKVNKKVKFTTGEVMPEIPKKKIKQAEKIPKRKPTIFTYNVKCNNSGKLLEMCCYKKTKVYENENADNQNRPIKIAVVDVNEENVISTKKRRRNKLHCTYSNKNTSSGCHEKDYVGKIKTTTAIVPSLDLIRNNLVQNDHIGYKQFGNKHVIGKVSKTLLLQRIDHKSKEICNSTFTDRAKSKNNASVGNNYDCSGNTNGRCGRSTHMLLSTMGKQENGKLFDDSLEDYGKTVDDETANLSKLFNPGINQHNVKLLTSFPIKTAINSEENYTLSSSLIDKFKQQIVKVAEKITPKDINQDHKSINGLIIDEIKQHEIMKLFNISFVKNTSKPHKEKQTNPLTYDNCNYSTNRANNLSKEKCEPHNLFMGKSKQQDNLSPKNRTKISEAKTMTHGEVKQKQSITFYNNFLIDNFDTAFTESKNLNKHLFLPTNQQKSRKLFHQTTKGTTYTYDKPNTLNSFKSNIKADTRCPVQDKLSLKKTKAGVRSPNGTNINKYLIKVNSKSNYELNTTSKFPTISGLKIKNIQHCTKSATTPKLLSAEKKTKANSLKSSSMVNIPYVISVKSFQKIKMDKVRFNSKFTLKNNLLQNDGIYYSSKRIKKMEELGMQNDLRSSLPAKCCTTTVLKQNSQVDLPYQVSLKSLPLAAKYNIKNRYDDFRNSKLNYYSNLETGFKGTPKNTYEVHYFELKGNSQQENKSAPSTNKTSETPEENMPSKNVSYSSDNKSADKTFNTSSEYSKHGPPWRQSFEVRVLEYVPEASDTDLPMAMSKARGTSTPVRSKSKYYGYPDDEEYMRIAKRKTMTDRRPDEDYPRMANRKTVERRADFAQAPHQHGESRLGLEPWAPFAISDTSLPGTRRPITNKSNYSPYPGNEIPTTSRVKSANQPPRNKDSEMSNQSRVTRAGPMPSQNIGRTDTGLNPVFLTSELLDKITRAIDSDRLPRNADVNPLFKNSNFGQGGYDLPVQAYSVHPFGYNMPPSGNAGNRFNCCPAQMCTVSTDTDDIQYEYPRKEIISSQQKQSSCVQCDLSHVSFQKAHRIEITKKTSQKSCTKQSDHGKMCMSGQPSTSNDRYTNQFKRTPESRQACKCGLSQDLCLCSYLRNCGTNALYGSEVSNQQTTNSKANQQTKNTNNCFRSYNPNPHVMYYLGEQRNTFFETESDSSIWKDQSIIVENIQQKSDLPCKLSTSSEYLTKADKMIAVTDTDTTHDSKRHSIIGQNTKVKNIINQQVQYRLDDQSNMKNIPFCSKINHSTSRNKIAVEGHKADIDNYYLLCLPNESALNNETIFQEKCEPKRLPHTKFIISNNNSPQQVIDLVYNSCNNNSTNMLNTLNAHSNPKRSCSIEQKSVRSKETAESNKAIGLFSGMYTDSTIYVFQADPKLDRTKNSTDPSVLTENTNILCAANEPSNEKVAVNQTSKKFQNKELLTENMKDKKTILQSDRFHNQKEDKHVEGHHYCLTEQEENPNKDISSGSNAFVQIYKELETLKNDCKCNTTLTDHGHNQNRIIRSSACRQNDTAKNHSQNKHSSEISRDVVNTNVSEQFSMHKQCNIGELKYSGNSSTSETFLKDIGWTKQFDAAVANIATKVLTNTIEEKNKLKNKRSAATVKKENYISNFLTEDNSKEIPIGDGTSKYSIIISQLADASTSSIQNSCVLSPPQYSGDVTDDANQSNSKGKLQSSKHFVDITTECNHCYDDGGKLFKHFSKSTQSPPVVYRSKLSDFVKISIPNAHFPNKLKLERKAVSYDLMSQPSKNCNETELDHESCTNTAVTCVCGGLPIDSHTRNKPKIEKCILLEEQPSNNISKNIQNTNKNNNDKQCEAFVQYVDTSQQTEELNNKVRCSSQSVSNMNNKENSCSVSKKPTLSLKTERRASNSVIQKSAILQDSNSEMFTEAYKSRLFLCDSWLRFPLQLENQKTIFSKNPFSIPPDYDESEFNVQASNSRHSNCETFRDNKDSNNGKYFQTSNANKVELPSNINKDNIRLHRSSSANLRKHSKDRICAFDGLREEYQKPPFPRIVPVALAASQQEFREVSSGPMTPVVLAISQEYQKVSPSAPTILSANDVHPFIDFFPNHTNHSVTNKGEVNISSATAYQEMNFNKPLRQDITKQCGGDSQDCTQYNGSTASICNEQHILDTVDTEFNKNSDKIYWALTKVKTHRDGSHDFEILETTPIPPGHFLISTANSVVLVGNQPCISDENKEDNHK